MVKNILIATPQPAFGELLRLSLEESGRYRVRLVQSGREALASADHVIFTLAVLDATLDSPAMVYVAQSLRKGLPNLRLLVIPSAEENPTDLKIDGMVSQPFYAPELLETIDHLTIESNAPSPVLPLPKPIGGLIQQTGPVFMNPGRTARRLEDFLHNSNAPGVLVILSRRPWASAGELSPAAMDEVAALMARYTESNEGVDLARFVHLSADGNEYLIYATPLTDGLVLALVYQNNTPLSVIRTQAGRLSRLLRQPFTSTAPGNLPFQPAAGRAAAQPTWSSTHQQSAAVATAAPPQCWSEEAELPEENDGQELGLKNQALGLMDMLSEMPSPNPPVGPEIINSDWVQAAPRPAPQTDEFLFPWEVEAERKDAGQTLSPQPNPPPSQHLPGSPQAGAAEVEEGLAETTLDAAGEISDVTPFDATLAISGRGSSLPTTRVLGSQPRLTSAQVASLEQTRPVILRSLQSIQQAQPLVPALSRLAYTCVLIPRLPGHLLVGQPAEQLTGWLPQLCLAYAWRLEGLLIRPEYLQWTVHVAPAISPGNVIRLIRQQSSRRIFSQFPQYEIDNPSGDFWAPGYLIISGFQPPSHNLVQDFIRQTRQRQGTWLA